MTFIRFVIAGFFLLLTVTSQAEDSYTVTNVYDGDTVELKNSSGKFKLRLANIDAPERNQAYGKKSRRALTKLCKGNKIVVTAQFVGIDKYNRHLGNLHCNQTDVALYLVEHGLAWHNAKYSNDLKTQNAEQLARQKRIGLWKSKKPIPPWAWRQRHPH